MSFRSHLSKRVLLLFRIRKTGNHHSNQHPLIVFEKSPVPNSDLLNDCIHYAIKDFFSKVSCEEITFTNQETQPFEDLTMSEDSNFSQVIIQSALSTLFWLLHQKSQYSQNETLLSVIPVLSSSISCESFMISISS